MYRDVDEDGEPRQDPDELSAEGIAGPVVEVERENSPSASPERDFFDRSPKAKTRRRLVRKSVVPEDSPRLDDLEEEESRPSKRKSEDSEEREVRKRRVQKVRDGRERMERDGRGAGSKKAKVGSSASKLAKLAGNGGGGNSKRVADAHRVDRGLLKFSNSRSSKSEKSPWQDPDAAECSDEEKELEPTQDNDMLIDDSHSFKTEEGQEDDKDQMDNNFRYFKSNKKKVSNEGTSVQIALFVEKFLAKLDVAAEEDADLNRDSKPAIEKLKLLPKLLNLLEKRQLQEEFLDRGILSSVKNWLEPLPDGSLPNLNIRCALLQLLTKLPIDVEVFERSEQLKKSNLGKVVMFFSRSSEETPVNRKLARDLVNKWSRSIFRKTTRYEDLRRYDDERPLPCRLPLVKKPVPKPRHEESRGEDNFELELNLERQLQPGDPGYRYRASRPQALAMDFVIRPASKMDAESVQAQTKLKLKEGKRSNINQKRSNINKKLQQLTKSRRRSLQAARLNVHGR